LTNYFASIGHSSLTKDMSDQLTEEEKDAIIAKQAEEIKRLKKKKRKTKTFVQENLSLFESLLDVKGKLLPSFLNGQEGDKKRHPRYFFSRPTKDKKSTEQVIRLNLLVADLLEAKIRLNPSMKDCTETEFNARLSMDTSSLIRHISIKPNTGKTRAARPRKKKKTESKPPQEKAILTDDAEPYSKQALLDVDSMISDPRSHQTTTSSQPAPSKPRPTPKTDPVLLAQYKERGFPYDDFYSAEADAWFTAHPEFPVPD